MLNTDTEPGILATGPTLDHAMTANPVLGSMDAGLRAAFRAAFNHPVRVGADGLLLGPDGGAGGGWSRGRPPCTSSAST